MTSGFERPDDILRHEAGGVVTLTLNRPAQYNALSEEMLGGLQAALDAVAADASVRCVVLAAKGKAFCAGHDLKQMRGRRGSTITRASLPPAAASCRRSSLCRCR